MSYALETFERFLRTLAFACHMVTWIILHIIEDWFRPLYFPLFGSALTKFLGVDPNTWMTYKFAWTLMEVNNIKLVGLGMDQFKEKNLRPCLVMYTHGSNLDPMALQAAFPFKLHFVAKKQLFAIPLLGKALYCLGAIPIDRGDIEKAKESLAKAAEYINKQNKSVSIAPEGTRRRKNSDVQPRIAPFKKGPFHLAKACKVPIIPVIMSGAFRLWPPGHFFVRSGIVYIKCLPAVPKENVEKLSVEELLTDVQKDFDKGMEEFPKDLPYTHNERKYGWFLFFLFHFFFCCFCFYKIVHLFISIRA